MEESTPQRKSFDKLIHSAITVETDLESNSSSSESEVGEEKDLTSIPSYLLSNHCLDSAFSQGTISVRVVKTTLLPPFQPYQINSHLVFGDQILRLSSRLVHGYHLLQLTFRDQIFSQSP